MIDYDMSEPAALMDGGPFAGDPTSSDRARVSSSLAQCFDFAATMTARARGGIYIRLDHGGVITAPEVEAFLTKPGAGYFPYA